MKIKTLKPHEYVNAEPGMSIVVDWYMSDDEDLRDYFVNNDQVEFVIEKYDNENDIIWLVDCEFAIDPELAIRA